MIAGISLDESIRIFGKRSGTSTKDVIQALRAAGVDCDDGVCRLRRGETLPDFCMAVVHVVGANRTHWTIWRDGLFYDPDLGIYDEYPPVGRITSYLTIHSTPNQQPK